MERPTPDYHRIYNDIINKKHPEKKEACKALLNKKQLSVLDIIELNNKIFGLSDRATETFNQKHRSYDTSAILKILDHQKNYNLNNTELAQHFKLSRNTVTKWKKIFLVTSDQEQKPLKERKSIISIK